MRACASLPAEPRSWSPASSRSPVQGTRGVAFSRRKAVSPTRCVPTVDAARAPSAFARRTSSAGRLHRRNGRSHRLRAERRRAMRARFGGAEPASAEKAPTSSPGHSRRSRGCEQQNRKRGLSGSASLLLARQSRVRSVLLACSASLARQSRFAASSGVQRARAPEDSAGNRSQAADF